MSIRYITYIVIFISALSILFIDSKSRNVAIEKDILSFIKLSTIVEPSFSIDSLDSKFLYTNLKNNRIYPAVNLNNKLGFVYVK